LLKKSFATAWLDNGGDVERLRIIAGWRSLDMLPVYVRSAIQQLEQAHRRAGPVDRLLD
jgi:site-specific recombinase XerD